MSRVAPVALVVLAVTAFLPADAGRAREAATTVPPGPAAGRPSRPAVVPVRLIPLSVKGMRFRPGERVRLSVVAGERRMVRTVRGTPSGSFTAAFGRLPVCDGIAVVATGDRGSRASFALNSLGCGSP